MNVLLIVADQHLATCMGVEGHPQAITPNLDRLGLHGGLTAADALTRQAVPMENDVLRVSLGSLEWKLLWVRAPDG
jgi:hypothetical protein